jgi:hypothetical protein
MNKITVDFVLEKLASLSGIAKAVQGGGVRPSPREKALENIVDSKKRVKELDYLKRQSTVEYRNSLYDQNNR